MLLDGATAALEAGGAEVHIREVPGALEIPVAIRIALESDAFDGFVALGCVIRGETSHYDTVSNDSSRGIMELGTSWGTPVGNGILTVENEEQAIVRADPAQKNKGADAAIACLALMALRDEFGDSGEELAESGGEPTSCPTANISNGDFRLAVRLMSKPSNRGRNNRQGAFDRAPRRRAGSLFNGDDRVSLGRRFRAEFEDHRSGLEGMAKPSLEADIKHFAPCWKVLVDRQSDIDKGGPITPPEDGWPAAAGLIPILRRSVPGRGLMVAGDDRVLPRNVIFQ
ncbi:UNVERIFIED_CONTAM: hypothetical protein GTU68_020375 [Idotea baltica]|nr:hypothetical protein [Idotea baltica]